MESKAKAFGHPIHPMLIVLPLGLLSAAVIFDLLYLIVGNEFFSIVAYYNIILGIIGGLAAAIFGLIDWLALPGGTRAKSVGLIHGIGNVILVGLFFLSWLLRRGDPNFAPSTLALIMSFAGIGLGIFTGWLGGELVYRLDVGTDRGAHLDSPNSLTGMPARSGRSAIPATGEDDMRSDEPHSPSH